MVFLNPTVLFGLIAASIPLIIHLINLKKLNKIEFSSLSFLKELQKSKIKKIKIKQWLLLLLRTLIIISIVLAFAKPTLESNSFIDLSDQSNTVSLFLIDNSFSMQTVDKDGSTFNKAKKTAKELISKSEPSAEYILFTESDSIIQYSNKDQIINSIDNLSISYRTESFSQKIIRALRILDSKKYLNKELFILSDFQKSTILSEISADSLSRESLKNISIYAINFPANNLNNLAITNPKLENSILELNKPINISANIHNYGSKQNTVASLFINNKRVAQKKVELSDKVTPILFNTSLTNYGFNEIIIQVEDDNIIEDNKCYLNFYVPREVNVLLVYDNYSDIEFLKTALSVNKSQIKLTTISSSDLQFQSLKNFEVLYYVSTKFDARLKDYINSGGNIVLFPPSNGILNDLNRLLRSISSVSFESKIEITDINNYDEFTKIDWTHPILNNIFENDEENKFESPKFFKFYKTILSNVANSIVELSNSKFMIEFREGKGTSIIFNTLPVMEWNNLPIKSIFAPLIFRTTAYLSSQQSVREYYLIGDVVKIDNNKIKSPTFTIETPQNIIKLNNINSQSSFYSFNKTELPGNYKISENNNVIDIISVNTNILESDLTRFTNEELNDFFNKEFGNNYLVFDFDSNFISQFKSAKLGVELWKHFLIIAFILALIEMFISKNTKKDIISVRNNL